MLTIENALKVLGLSESATRSDIRDAYRDLYTVWDPFMNLPRKREIITKRHNEIKAAYSFLRSRWNLFDAHPTKAIQERMNIIKQQEGIGVLEKLGITMNEIPGGTFLLGARHGEENKPAKRITLSSFFMSIHEITQGQYISVMGSNPSHHKGNENRPVERVSWWDALRFCNRLSELMKYEKCYNVRTGAWDFNRNGFRLPREEEWEYAYRAGTKTKFHFGDDESDLEKEGWIASNSDTETHPVGQKEPNSFGLYDMQGNVSEWCHDRYCIDPSEFETKPFGTKKDSFFTKRGLAFDYYFEEDINYGFIPNPPNAYRARRDLDIGFRIVRSCQKTE